jgi:hypothetical protein
MGHASISGYKYSPNGALSSKEQGGTNRWLCLASAHHHVLRLMLLVIETSGGPATGLTPPRRRVGGYHWGLI